MRHFGKHYLGWRLNFTDAPDSTFHDPSVSYFVIRERKGIYTPGIKVSTYIKQLECSQNELCTYFAETFCIVLHYDTWSVE